MKSIIYGILLIVSMTMTLVSVCNLGTSFNDLAEFGAIVFGWCDIMFWELLAREAKESNDHE